MWKFKLFLLQNLCLVYKIGTDDTLLIRCLNNFMFMMLKKFSDYLDSIWDTQCSSYIQNGEICLCETKAHTVEPRYKEVGYNKTLL